MRLKDGSTVLDPRLDRIAEFDERSRRYGIRKALRADQKRRRSYTWRCLLTLDQGAEGACVGAGIAHELIARPSAVPGITMDWARRAVYWEAQRRDPWAGGAYPGADPFYEGTSVLAGVQVARAYGYFDEYRWGFGLDDLILGVGHNGPAVLGVCWYRDMGQPDSEGYIWPRGAVQGGHCILCRAVSVKRRDFTLHNSWGRGWGDNGDCRVTWDAMDTLLRADGEACFFVGRHRRPLS